MSNPREGALVIELMRDFAVSNAGQNVGSSRVVRKKRASAKKEKPTKTKVIRVVANLLKM